MELFTSKRERTFWLWTLAVVVAIYATLGLTGALALELRERELLTPFFIMGLLLMMSAVVASALKRRPTRREVWVALGVIAVYGMVLIRMGLEERSHLFEYSVVALLIHAALTERKQNGRAVLMPGLLAVVMTAVVGWLDEGIQAFLPSRVYDLVDVGFNALAGTMAVLGKLALQWAGNRLTKKR